MFAEITPSPAPVAAAEVLDEISTIFTRHLILPNGAADAMALWVFHAHSVASYRRRRRAVATGHGSGAPLSSS